MDIALAGGVFINTPEEWQELNEAGWQVWEDYNGPQKLYQ